MEWEAINVKHVVQRMTAMDELAAIMVFSTEMGALIALAASL
jgi:hypothetical protein